MSAWHAMPSLYGGWSVVRGGAKRALRRGLTKERAWTTARCLARGKKGVAYLHNEDGRIACRNSYKETS